jgi:hypothetical protein
VVVLPPEAVGDRPADEHAGIAAVMDLLLTTSVTNQEGLTLIDRQSLDAVLGEHERRAGGLAKNDARPIDAPLRQLLSAGILVSTEIDTSSRVVAVEAVSAQRGTRLGGMYFQAERLDRKSLSNAITTRARAFWDEVRTATASEDDRPLVEVVAQVPENLERIRWLTDEAARHAQARVAAAKGLTLLAPRRPLTTKEERFLRVAGLAKRADGDRGASLRAAPDVVVDVKVSERAEVGTAFDQTPVTARVTITMPGRDPKQQTFSMPASRWHDVLAEMDQWLDRELADIGPRGAPSAEADDERARDLAGRAMASIEPWTSLSRHAIEDLPIQIRVRLHDIALRAVHLDPTNEQATRMMVLTLMADAEAVDWGQRPDEYYRRHLVEGRRYLDRFGDRNRQHHADMLNHVGQIGLIYTWHLERPDGEHRIEHPLLGEPDPRIYEVARIVVPVEAEDGLRGLSDDMYGGGNVFQVFGQHLCSFLIPNIPKEILDHEYEFWHAFYEKRIEPLPRAQRYKQHGADVVVPWELVEATFAARRRDPATVRRNLQAVAAIYPRSIEAIWGRPSDTVLRVPMLLKAAGDPEWETWMPTFDKREDVRVSVDDMTILNAILSPRATRPWDVFPPTPLPGRKLVVPKAVRNASFQEGNTHSRCMTAIFQTGHQLWMTAPSLPSARWQPYSRLLVATLPLDESEEVHLDPMPIPWPAKDILPGQPTWTAAHCIVHEDNPVVFMGTEKHGILRLDMFDGRWSGHWINTQHGLPANRVRRLATIMNGGEQELLVIGGDHEPGRTFDDVLMEDVVMVYRVSLDANATTLLHDGRQNECQMYAPAAVLRDGRSVYLELAGSRAYSKPLDGGDIVALKNSVRRWPHGFAMPFTRPSRAGQSATLWSPWWDSQCHSFDAFDADTLEQLENAAPGEGAGDSGFPAVSRDVRWVLGNIVGRSGAAYGATRIGRWPCMGMPFSAGTADVIWIGLNTGMAGNDSNLIVGYRPAPRGTTDWESDDSWIGPFVTPNRDLIDHVIPAEKPGTFLLSTLNHMMLLDEREMVEAAKKAGAMRSTKQWRKEYRDRLAKAGWRSLVPALVVDARHDQALEVLADAKASLNNGDPGGDDRLAIEFWTACVLAGVPDRRGEAIAAYDRLARNSNGYGAAEAFARANQVVLLRHTEQWEELIDVAEAMVRRFPQTVERGQDSAITVAIAEAREHLKAHADAPTKEE